MPKFFTLKEYEFIANQFALGDIYDIDYFEGGLAAPKVAVKTPKGKFVIAKYKLGKGDNFKNKPRQSLEDEIILLNFLQKLPIPIYITTKAGNYIYDYKHFAFTAYRYLQGENKNHLNKKQVFELGKFLGNFHKQGEKLKNKFINRYKFYDFSPQRMAEMKPYAYQQKNPKLKKIVEDVEQSVIVFKPKSDLLKGPIHVDIKSDNLLWSKDNLTGVIDFGNFYHGPFILDVGKAIIFNCTKGDVINKNLKRAFLRGYVKFRKLSQEEIDYIDEAILYSLYSHIWLDLYHVPVRLVPESHTLYFVETFLPAAQKLKNQKSN